MNDVARCTKELTAAVCGSKAYKNFEKSKMQVKENPELHKRLNQFRRRNYELQNRKNSYSCAEEEEAFKQEAEEFRKDPLVDEYLSSELELCKMIQRINQSIVSVIQFEIEEFTDAIEW